MDGLLFKKTVQEIKPILEGAFVSKIYQPVSNILHLNLRGQKEDLNFFAFLEPRLQGIFLGEKNLPNPRNPSAFTMLLRKHLQGMILQEISQPGLERLLCLSFGNKKLVIEIMGRYSNLALLQDDLVLGVLKPQREESQRPIMPNISYKYPPGQGKVHPQSLSIADLKDREEKVWRVLFNTVEGLGPHTARELAYRAQIDPEENISQLDDTEIKKLEEVMGWLTNFLQRKDSQPTALIDHGEIKNIFPFNPNGWPHLQRKHFSTLSSMVEEYILKSWFKEKIEKERTEIKKVVQKELNRKKRKSQKLQEDYRKAKNHEELRIKGELLTAYAHNIKKGMKEITLPNFYDSEKPLSIELKPHLSPQANSQNYFKQYRKRKKAVKHLQREYNKNMRLIKHLEQVLHFLQEAETLHELEEIREELIGTGIMSPKKKQKKPEKTYPLSFASPDGHTVLIGRNNKQNDEILRSASSEDLWLHVKEMPGSHGIIKTNGQKCPESTLLFAAELVAYYSKARHSSKVPVDYTKVKNVKKPRGSPPGFVRYENYKTIMVSPQKS